MSNNPMENKSTVTNSSEEFRVTGREIQAQVEEKKMVVDYGSIVLHTQVAQILRRMVSESLSKLKPAEKKIEILDSHEKDIPKRGRPPTSTLVKELAITFKLPNNCIANKIDVDKIALSYRKSCVRFLYHSLLLKHEQGKVIPAPQFSFKERLEGWKIECRQRLSNVYDTFYRHTKAKRSFRSLLEVVRFLLYETYPNAKNENKPTVTDIQNKQMMVEDTAAMIMRETATIKRDTKASFSSDDIDKEAQEERYYKMMVKEFFKESYRNLMDCDYDTDDDDEDTDDDDDDGDEEEELVWESEEMSSNNEERKNQKGLQSGTVKNMLKRTMGHQDTDEQRDGVKKPRTEKVSSEKEPQEEVQYQDEEIDELIAAEVLLNLKTERIDQSRQEIRTRLVSKFQKISKSYGMKQHIPVGKSIHELAQFLLKVEGQACRCRCRSIQISE